MKETHKWTKDQVKSAQVVNFGKKYIWKPTLLKLIGEVQHKKLLELGSGNGHWLELFSTQGALCTGVELAKNQIQLAREKNTDHSITYIEGDITKLDKLPLKSNSYDIILLEHVILEIESTNKLKKIFNGAYNLLKTGGILVVSDLHPFAPALRPKNMKIDTSFTYFSSGKTIEIISKRIDGQEILYKDYHWTLEDICDSITQSGLKLISIIEPKPTPALAKKYPELAYRLETPMGIMFKAVK